MENKIEYYEKQKFTQWWLWLILLGPLGYIVYKIFSPIILENASSSENTSFSLAMPIESWTSILILLLVALFIFISSLKTTINKVGISIQHLLVVRKKWLWEDIESAKIVKYGFVGYGIRISLNHGTVYNVKGNKGLLLKFKDGKKRLIGTQRPDELKKVIKEILS